MNTGTLPERPLLKPWYRVVRTDGRVLLEHGDAVASLEGGAARELVPALLRLLDGTRTRTEILDQLGAPFGPAAERALTELVRCGAVTEGPALGDSVPQLETASFLASLDGGAPHELLTRLDSARVAVIGRGSLADEVSRLLRQSVRGRVDRVAADVHSDALAGADFALAAPSGATQHELAAVNRAALETGTPWLQLVPFDGRHAAIGPLFVPGETCCRTCYRLRRASVSGYPEEYELLASAGAARPAAPAAASVLGGLACLVALRWLAERDPLLAGVCYVLELRPALTVTSHVVYRVPRCPDCSTVVADPVPWHEEAS